MRFVALPTSLRHDLQLLIQLPSFLPVEPDAFIDCLVADGERSMNFEDPGDLLRTPLLSYQTHDHNPLLFAMAKATTCLFPSSNRLFVRLVRTIPTVARSSVACQLPADGTRGTPQPSSGLRL